MFGGRSNDGGRRAALLTSDNGDGYSSMSSSGDRSLIQRCQQYERWIFCGVIAVLAIVIMALAAALNSARKEETPYVPPSLSSSTGAMLASTASPPPIQGSSSSSLWPPPPPPSLSSSSGPSDHVSLESLVSLEELMRHANSLQQIAHDNSGNRYINMPGFNASVAYIEQQLRTRTNFQITKQYFTRNGFAVLSASQLNVSTPYDSIGYQYNTDFNVWWYSASLVAAGAPMATVPSLGCNAAAWQQPLPAGLSLAGSVVVLEGGCATNTLRTFARNAGVIGLIIYNTDPRTGLPGMAEAPVGSGMAWLAMTYETGRALELAVSAANASDPLLLSLNLNCSSPPTVITNICADTPSGDPTSTIVLGSHSDGVFAGSGIVDNGSGTCSNLAWAMAVSAALASPGFTPFPNRLRFCWWGAEEQGLLGSRYHVQQARNATKPGDRLSDYQLNLNADMSACPNFVFGILNGSTGVNTSSIPPAVIPGSEAITRLFVDWFEGRHLPWDSKTLNGGSDYQSFLEAGVPAGGVSAFINRMKTEEERDRYDRMLGPGKGGIPNIAIDPCYHQHCDTVANINPLAFETISKAHAAIIQHLAALPPQELHRFLWPQLREGEPRPVILEQPELPVLAEYE